MRRPFRFWINSPTHLRSGRQQNETHGNCYGSSNWLLLFLKKAKNGFEANFKKLEQLSEELQENRVSIDELVPRMKEALSSIKVCKEVLKETKSQLNEVNEEFAELEDSLDTE